MNLNILILDFEMIWERDMERLEEHNSLHYTSLWIWRYVYPLEAALMVGLQKKHTQKDRLGIA